MTFFGNIVYLRPCSVICANDTTRAQINNIPSKSHVIPLFTKFHPWVSKLFIYFMCKQGHFMNITLPMQYFWTLKRPSILFHVLSGTESLLLKLERFGMTGTLLH